MVSRLFITDERGMSWQAALRIKKKVCDTTGCFYVVVELLLVRDRRSSLILLRRVAVSDAEVSALALSDERTGC